MSIWIWLGIIIFLFAMWMWWEIKHAEELPEDFDDNFDAYDDNWFDNNKPAV